MTITNTSVVINGGAQYTKTLNVSLKIHAEGNVRAFIVSEDPNFSGVRWSEWPSTGTNEITKSYTLSSISGLFGSTVEQARRIYVAFSTSLSDVNKFFDATNLIGSAASYNRYYQSSATASDLIVLDTAAPIPVGPVVAGSHIAFHINAGDTYSTQRIVTINSYMLNASEMRVEELSSGTTFTTASAWVPYTPNLTGFVLSEGAGVKRVVIQYRDVAGNTSDFYTDSIELLGAAPDYTLLINDGGIYTYSRSLKISLTLTDPTLLSTIGSVWISEYENFAVRDVYAAPDLPTILNAPFTYTFRTTPGEGLKTIYVRIYDNTGAGYGYGSYEERIASIFLDTTTPNINSNIVPDGKIVVVNPSTGGIATNSADVTIAFQGVQSAQSVIISNDPDFSGASWQYYSPNQSITNTTFSHTLDTSSGNGIKFVYVRFSDYVESGSLFDSIGNVTKTYVGEISYDTLAPIIPIVSACGSTSDGYLTFDGYQIDGYTRDGYFIKGYPRAIVINSDDEYVLLETTTVNGVSRFYVHLTLTASGATQMRLSTSLNDNGSIPDTKPWVPYSQTYYYDVPPLAGTLAVYVQFRDEAGNTTQVYSDTIEVIDGAPVVPGPLGPYAILIEGGAQKTNKNTVDLVLNATYNSTLEMIISESDTFASATWEPYQTTTTYSFRDTSDGTKTVFVKYRITLSGGFIRESSVYSDTIIKDTTAPELRDPAILIDGGNTFTRDRTVNLLFNIGGSPIMMQVVNEVDYNPSNFSSLPWIPYQAQIAWLLSSGNGTKRVYARFKDDIGNTTVFVSATITYNRDLPQAPVITTPSQGSTVNQRVINVQGTAEPGAIVSVTVRPLS